MRPHARGLNELLVETILHPRKLHCSANREEGEDEGAVSLAPFVVRLGLRRPCPGTEDIFSKGG